MSAALSVRLIGSSLLFSGDGGGADFSSGSIENSPTFGEDIMQIAFKMATEMDEPAIQMENQLVPPATMPSPTQTDTPQGLLFTKFSCKTKQCCYIQYGLQYTPTSCFTGLHLFVKPIFF